MLSARKDLREASLPVALCRDLWFIDGCASTRQPMGLDSSPEGPKNGAGAAVTGPCAEFPAETS